VLAEYCAKEREQIENNVDASEFIPMVAWLGLHELLLVGEKLICLDEYYLFPPAYVHGSTVSIYVFAQQVELHINPHLSPGPQFEPPFHCYTSYTACIYIPAISLRIPYACHI